MRTYSSAIMIWRMNFVFNAENERLEKEVYLLKTALDKENESVVIFGENADPSTAVRLSSDAVIKKILLFLSNECIPLFLSHGGNYFLVHP
ncbi:unnamed protein product [Haemonchus placei]|uniref:Uncharacterized protein n=1 Tax=Haemonchus placei TaxID=6290 RepID=A0A3P7X5J6_HAEPC|nr:unnamed protein product [Haemonchus placei]